MIWNPIIRDSTITFNSIEKTAKDVVNMIGARQSDGRGFFVARDRDQTLGFATYDQFRSGSGYAQTMEHTIILAPAARTRGVGRTLLAELEAHAKQHGARSMIGGISSENTDAIAFHARMGYSDVGRIKQAGFKFSRWIDTIFMQKML